MTRDKSSSLPTLFSYLKSSFRGLVRLASVDTCLPPLPLLPLPGPSFHFQYQGLNIELVGATETSCLWVLPIYWLISNIKQSLAKLPTLFSNLKPSFLSLPRAGSSQCTTRYDERDISLSPSYLFVYLKIRHDLERSNTASVKRKLIKDPRKARSLSLRAHELQRLSLYFPRKCLLKDT